LKRIIILLVAVIMLFALVACEQGQQPDNGDTNPPTTNQTEGQPQNPTTGDNPPQGETPPSGQTPVTPPSGEHEDVHVHNFYYGECGTCEITPVSTWDISKSGDGSLKAYLYSVDSNYTLEIAGDGEMLEQEYNEFMPWRPQRDKITNIVFNGALTHISQQAFNGTAITSLELPNTLVYIGEEAFSASTKLTEVVIPANVIEIDRLAFFMCTKLQEVDISRSTEIIGINAFQYCPELTTVTFGHETTAVSTTLTIKDGAFSSCEKLTNFSLPAHTIQIGVDAFKGAPDALFTYEGNVAYLDQWLIKPSMTNVQSIDISETCIGIADGAFEDCDNLLEVTVPSSVTRLGAYAFRSCDNLQTVSLPLTITEIKDGTFYNCQSLTTVNIPKYTTSVGTHAFYNCDSLEGIIIPVEIQFLGGSAFYGCDNLKQLAIISQSIRVIGSHCFYDCNQLRYVTFASMEEHWELATIEQGNAALTNAIILFSVPYNHLHTITTTDPVAPTCHSKGYTASVYCSECRVVFEAKEELGVVDHEYGTDDFCSCGQKRPTEELILELTVDEQGYQVVGITDQTISNIVIPKYYEGLPVVEIEIGAFRDNRNIVSVYIPSTVKSIGNSAFSQCENLETVILSEGLEVITNFAFSWCTDLVNIDLPQSLTAIGPYAFNDCSSLMNVDLPAGLTVLGDAAFDGCTSLQSITIPDTIEGIESFVFQNCTSLANVTLPNTITYIDDYAFYGCTSLTEFSLPTDLTWLGEHCFSHCKELTEVELNAKLTEIDKGVFKYCTKLATIKFMGTTDAWESIELNEDWVASTAVTKIECSDGDIPLANETT